MGRSSVLWSGPLPYRLSDNPTRTPESYFVDINKVVLKFTQKSKRPRRADPSVMTRSLEDAWPTLRLNHRVCWGQGCGGRTGDGQWEKKGHPETPHRRTVNRPPRKEERPVRAEGVMFPTGDAGRKRRTKHNCMTHPSHLSQEKVGTSRRSRGKM